MKAFIILLVITPVVTFLLRLKTDARFLGPLVFVALCWLSAFVLVRALMDKVYITTRTTSKRNETPWKYWYMCGLTLVLYVGCVVGIFLSGR